MSYGIFSGTLSPKVGVSVLEFEGGAGLSGGFGTVTVTGKDTLEGPRGRQDDHGRLRPPAWARRSSVRGASRPHAHSPPPAPAGDHSARLNSTIAIASITTPSRAMTAASTTVGTCQPNQVTPGSSARRAAALTFRCAKIARRIGSTA